MINTNSRDWMDVSAYVNKRIEALKNELCDDKFTHTMELDGARRAKMSELRLLVSTLTKKPENQDE